LSTKSKASFLFIKLFPNVITLLALAVGLSSIRFAIEGKWELAVTAIIVAAILDGFDGRIARMLNATSTFGAELDSLADFVNFGVAPVIVIYLWSLHTFKYKLLSWGAVLLYNSCMAIRLARFNTAMINEILPKHFFVGVPAPIGALLVLAPVMLEFDIAQEYGISPKEYLLSTIIYVVVIGFLLASRIPTISLKYISIRPEYVWISLLISSISIILAIIYPWYAIPYAAILYLATIPLCAYVYRAGLDKNSHD
jgi:CDP-diacylglycerol--serine O-phosphatidyltransferase